MLPKTYLAKGLVRFELLAASFKGRVEYKLLASTPTENLVGFVFV